MIGEEIQRQLRLRFNPDGSMLRRHQLRMLEMLKYIDAVCRKHNIKYWLCSGTLIGAVRHGGFIPWDDDVDIEMLREDYKKFVRVMANESQTDYVLQTHETDKGYFYPYAKLRDLHSCIKENHLMDTYYKYKGCFVDIFIMEPSSSFFLHRLSCFLQSFLIIRPSLFFKNKWIRFIYFSVTYTIVYKVFFPIIRFLSCIGANGQLRHTEGTGFIKPRNISDILPLKKICFEGVELPVPNNFDAYLRKIYGDYMCLPDLENVKVHTEKMELY